ncbi:hypothetical protein BaRGS_00022550 [Batillaria attramentaria]|uniref:Uncharacterized protein n=1 Tax=Batillaria attramentaria TaxID=370345 RepID=A0ABD0KGS3_9CAEN
MVFGCSQIHYVFIFVCQGGRRLRKKGREQKREWRKRSALQNTTTTLRYGSICSDTETGVLVQDDKITKWFADSRCNLKPNGQALVATSYYMYTSVKQRPSLCIVVLAIVREFQSSAILTQPFIPSIPVLADLQTKGKKEAQTTDNAGARKTEYQAGAIGFKLKLTKVMSWGGGGG